MTTVTGTNSSVTYIHTDGLGSPVARTDASGNPVSRTRYEPYGYVDSGVQPTIGFTGHVNDADTGLTYMQQRYYDPVAGRFLSIDPLLTDANKENSSNRYNYALNSPYRYVDPDGRNPLVIEGAIAGGEIGSFAGPIGTAVGIVGGSFAALWLGDKLIGILTFDGRRDAAKGLNGGKVSDREPGPDGKRGSTGGPGAGKRVPVESPETKDSKEGVPCLYCGRETTNEPGKDNSRERDHIDPRSKGGNNSPENEGDSCRSCNRSKSGRSPDE